MGFDINSIKNEAVKKFALDWAKNEGNENGAIDEDEGSIFIQAADARFKEDIEAKNEVFFALNAVRWALNALGKKEEPVQEETPVKENAEVSSRQVENGGLREVQRYGIHDADDLTDEIKNKYENDGYHFSSFTKYDGITHYRYNKDDGSYLIDKGNGYVEYYNAEGRKVQEIKGDVTTFYNEDGSYRTERTDGGGIIEQKYITEYYNAQGIREKSIKTYSYGRVVTVYKGNVQEETRYDVNDTPLSATRIKEIDNYRQQVTDYNYYNGHKLPTGRDVIYDDRITEDKINYNRDESGRLKNTEIYHDDGKFVWRICIDGNKVDCNADRWSHDYGYPSKIQLREFVLNNPYVPADIKERIQSGEIKITNSGVVSVIEFSWDLPETK